MSHVVGVLAREGWGMGAGRCPTFAEFLYDAFTSSLGMAVRGKERQDIRLDTGRLSELWASGLLGREVRCVGSDRSSAGVFIPDP